MKLTWESYTKEKLPWKAQGIVGYILHSVYGSLLGPMSVQYYVTSEIQII